jgi:hypothetical protein
LLSGIAHLHVLVATSNTQSTKDSSENNGAV